MPVGAATDIWKFLSGDAVWVLASPRGATAVGLRIPISAQVNLKVQDCTTTSLKTNMTL